MADFSKLKGYAVDAESTAEFTFWRVEGEPRLRVRPANSFNKAYFNASLRQNAKLASALRAGKQFDLGMIEQTRAVDRDLYPAHIIVDWADVTDSDGATVVFSKDACTDFLAALPDNLFDELRGFAADADNFVETPDFSDTVKN